MVMMIRGCGVVVVVVLNFLFAGKFVGAGAGSDGVRQLQSGGWKEVVAPPQQRMDDALPVLEVIHTHTYVVAEPTHKFVVMMVRTH